MKLSKLSLTTVLVLGITSSSFAADSLSDAFKKGVVSGELKAYYTDRVFDVAPDILGASTTNGHVSIFNTGVLLGYTTEEFQGFKLGTTMQSNYAPFASEEAKKNAYLGGFGTDMYGSGAVLSEAYLAYNFGTTNVKIGRQFINTPLISKAPDKVIFTSYEGITVTNNDIPDTTLMAGIITKYQGWTDMEGNAPVFRGLNETALTDERNDHAYTLMVINKSIPHTTLTGQWVQLENNWNAYFGEIRYSNTLGDLRYGLFSHLIYQTFNDPQINPNFAPLSTLENHGMMYGAKINLGYKQIQGYLAYDRVTDNASLENMKLGAAGLGAEPAYAIGYNGFSLGEYVDDTTAYAANLRYTFENTGLSIASTYIKYHFGQGSSTKSFNHLYDKSVMQFAANYKFGSTLKGLSLELSNEIMGEDYDGQNIMLKTVYKF